MRHFLSALLSFNMVFVLSLALTANRAEAAPSGGNGWLGGEFGLSVPNADNSTTRPIYGITAGALLGDEFGFGAYYLSSAKDEDALLGKTAFNYDLYGVEFTYRFEGEAAGVYFGGRIGTSKIKAGSNSTSPMNYGAVVGVDKMLASAFSLGGEFSWMSVASSSGISAFNMLNFNLTAKFWF